MYISINVVHFFISIKCVSTKSRCSIFHFKLYNIFHTFYLASTSMRKGWTVCPNLGEFDVQIKDMGTKKVISIIKQKSVFCIKILIPTSLEFKLLSHLTSKTSLLSSYFKGHHQECITLLRLKVMNSSCVKQ